ncbi:MAG: flagellar brake protein [Nitrospinota bacterium]
MGTVLQLVDPVNKVRLNTRLVGWDPDHCLIVEQPTRGGQSVQLPKNLPVVGRGMHEGRVWGFQSAVLFQTLQPFRVLYLAYPKKIEEVSLRKTERLNTRIRVLITPRKHDYATLAKDENASWGVIKNLSVGGCSLSCPFRFEVNMPVFMSFELPDGSVPENIMGFVRNVTREQSENLYGVQFDKRAGKLDGVNAFVHLASKLIPKSGMQV